MADIDSTAPLQPVVSIAIYRQAAQLFSHVIQNSDNARCEISTLQKAMRHQISGVVRVIKALPDMFVLSEDETFVDLKCPVDICKQHWSSNGCSTEESCPKLHICKFFVMKSCSNRNCKFDHSFTTPHNDGILEKTDLCVLDEELLKKIVTKCDALKEAVERKGTGHRPPLVCNPHNSVNGCRKGPTCQFMHICERYIKVATCAYTDDKCPYSHNLMEPQVKQILLKYGYQLTYENLSNVLRDIRRKYKEAESNPNDEQRSQPRDNNYPSRSRSRPDDAERRGHGHPAVMEQPQIGVPYGARGHSQPFRDRLPGGFDVGPPRMRHDSPNPRWHMHKEREHFQTPNNFPSPRQRMRMDRQRADMPYNGPPGGVLPNHGRFPHDNRHHHSGPPPSYRQGPPPVAPENVDPIEAGLHALDVRPRDTRYRPDMRRGQAHSRDRITADRRPRSHSRDFRRQPKFTPLIDKTQICTFHLRNKCRHSYQCKLLHTTLPYLWQYKEKETWISCIPKSNDALELSYCEPKNVEMLVAVSDSTNEMRVNYDKMTYEGFGRGEIRRLSTESWGKAFKNRPFITQWMWYWLDEYKKWQPYADSVEVEEEFMKPDTSEFGFTTGANDYILYFTEMKQKNKNFGTSRDVRRRPALYKKPAEKESNEQKQNEVCSEQIILPETWVTGSDEDYELKLEDVDPNSAEYAQVSSRFLETMTVPIKRMIRIQNIDLWEEYASMKKRMLKKKLGTVNTTTKMEVLCRELNEQLLFHGTHQQYIEPIYTHRGFDFRNAGASVGSLFGKGTYFAKDASYSKCYTNCKRLFVVKVLVGEIAAGDAKYTKPPPLDATQPYGRLYDCCVDDVTKPSIYVTFEFSQSYPAYLLDY